MFVTSLRTCGATSFMAKNKGVRIVITLECTECRSNPAKRSPGVSRYTTEKNRRNTTERLDWRPHCKLEQVHGQEGRLQSVEIHSANGVESYYADVFVDGSDLGDLLALSSAPFRWGWEAKEIWDCLLYTSPSPRDATLSRMPSSA